MGSLAKCLVKVEEIRLVGSRGKNVTGQVTLYFEDV